MIPTAEKYATVGRRIVAIIVDSLIVVSPFLAVYFAVEYAPFSFLAWSATVDFVFEAVGIFAFVIYTVSFHAIYSQTPGKMLMGLKLRVIKDDGAPVGWPRALIRDSVWILLAVLDFAACFETYLINGVFSESYSPFAISTLVITALWAILLFGSVLNHYQHRGFHDRLAGTVVVNLKAERLAEPLPERLI
ncbi:MAG: RDD family protein [Verrucomicrobiota bacterium]